MRWLLEGRQKENNKTTKKVKVDERETVWSEKQQEQMKDEEITKRML